ncbi:uncharacterized protein LOC144874087 [Branchiostoma floridae x Branchiostoma japonicum]
MAGPCTSGFWKWTVLVLIVTTATVTAQGGAPNIELISAWPSAKLYYQETLTLTCHGGGDPAPTYSWTRDPDPLPARAVVDGSAGTLTVTDATDSDGGVYTCTADNGVGTVSMSITVVGCPDITTCADSVSTCRSWAASGECSTNPGYMLLNCKLSCDVCFPNLGAHCIGIRRGRSWDTWECYDVTGVPDTVRNELSLDDFYQKYLHAYGIPILGSSIVPDEALRRACYDVLFMFADRKDIRDSYYNYYGRAAIMADTELTLDIPEHSTLDPLFNMRARGLAATVSKPVSTGAEENVLCYSTDRYKGEDIFIREVGNGLDILGATRVISDFQTRLNTAYFNALANGLWANTYAIGNSDNYWGEGVQSFFNVNMERDPPDGIHNHVNTRAELLAYDPDLYALVADIFPCGNFPAQRCDKDYANHTLKMDCFSESYQRTTVEGDAVWGETPTSTAAAKASVARSSTAATTPTVTSRATTKTLSQSSLNPDIKVISAWPSANLYYQETLTLTCHGNGDPAPTYTWTRDSGALPARAVVDGSAGTLTVPDATDSDGGMYTCTADNGVGTASMSIDVVGCPDVATCPDSDSNCPSWARSGECDNNPRFMLNSCRLSCGVCFPNIGAHCTTKRRGRSWDTWECYDVTGVPDTVRNELNLDEFYQKYLHAYGIPILGSSIVPDEALRRACYDVLFMLADRKDIRDSYYNYYGRAAIMADTEVTLDIPEQSNLDSSYNTRARGLGATVSRPVSTGAEENVLCYSTDRYKKEDIFVHEFAHGVDNLGARKAISDWTTRLKAAYDDSLANGLWSNVYPEFTKEEFWAEGVQSFFNVNNESDPPDGVHNHVNTRAELLAYDPTLYALIAEIFPCGNLIVNRCEKDYANYTLKMDCLPNNYYRRATVVGNAVWGEIPTTTPSSSQGPTTTPASSQGPTTPPSSSQAISTLALNDAGIDHLTISWTVVGSPLVSRYRLRYQPADGFSSYQDLSPAPGADAVSATVPGLLPETSYTLTLTSFGVDDQPNGVLSETYTTDSVVVNVECDQDSMTISIPLAALPAVDVENMHLLDPSCGATVDGDVVILETNLQECGTQQETSGDDKFIFSNEAIANQVTYANGAVRKQPINLPFQCEFLRQYDVSHGGAIMYNIPSPRVRIVHANNTFTIEMQMYTSTDFSASYDSIDYPIKVTPSDRINFGLSVTSSLDNLELFAHNCVSTPTTNANDSPQVNIIDDGCTFIAP